MQPPSFDPSRAVEFDVGRGRVADDGGSPRLLVPVEALSELCRSASAEAQKSFGHAIGTEAGRRAAKVLGDGSAASLESVLDHLGGNLAIFGLGALGVERWGQALVLTITGSPMGPEGDTLLGAVIEGGLMRAVSRQVNIVNVDRDGGRIRFLVTTAATATRVSELLTEGVGLGDLMTRLNAGIS